MKIFIVIPAYNEEKSIHHVIESLISQKYSNIIVVDDGSKDQTAQIAKKYPIKVIKHIINLGQGAALQTGTELALQCGAEVVVHFDSDNQHKAEEIAGFINMLGQGNDVVLGSRFLGKTQQVPKVKKWLILKPAIGLNWIFTGLRLSDAHNGFRALNRKAAQTIKITQNRMAHATEIQAEISRHNLKYKEIPVEIVYHEFGQGFIGGIKVIIDLLKQKIFS